MIKVRVATCAELIPDFTSWQIMRRTKYKASHIFLIYKGDVYEAADNGIVRWPVGGGKGSDGKDYPALLDDHRIVDDFDLAVPCHEHEFYAWFRKYQDLPYSCTQWGGFVMPKWTHWFFKNGRQAAICTEFVCWFLTDLMKWPGFDEDEFKSPGEVIAMIKDILGLK